MPSPGQALHKIFISLSARLKNDGDVTVFDPVS